MNFIKSMCAAVVVAVAAATSASATTLLIDFDGASGDGGTIVNETGFKSYNVGGYIMEPVNIQSGLCADGKCTIEATQTVEPTLYREDLTNFDIFSFYFLNTGTGAIGDPAANFTTLSLYDSYEATIASYSFDFGNEVLFSVYEAMGLTIDYFDGEGSDPGSYEACFEDKICKNYGYVIGLGDFGLNVGRAVWTSAGDANARIDDIVVSAVPLPAAGWLMLVGFGGLAAFRRRKVS
jgi:hypothetical protein